MNDLFSILYRENPGYIFAKKWETPNKKAVSGRNRTPPEAQYDSNYFLEFSTMLQMMSAHWSMPRTPVSRQRS